MRAAEYPILGRRDPCPKTVDDMPCALGCGHASPCHVDALTRQAVVARRIAIYEAALKAIIAKAPMSDLAEIADNALDAATNSNIVALLEKGK